MPQLRYHSILYFCSYLMFQWKKQLQMSFLHFPTNAAIIISHLKKENMLIWNIKHFFTKILSITLVFWRNSSQLSGSSSGNLQSGTLLISWRTASIRNSIKSFTLSSNNSSSAFEAKRRFKTSLKVWNNSFAEPWLNSYSNKITYSISY